VGVFGGRSDLGVITEYLYDDRRAQSLAIGDNDVAIGFRYSLNNASDTTALIVSLWDVETHEYLTTLETNSRLGSNWKIIVEASVFSNGKTVQQDFSGFLQTLFDPESELAFFQGEDFFKIELIRYF
jgi:hypothetical protein